MPCPPQSTPAIVGLSIVMAVLIIAAPGARADVTNIKVVTDASPDFTDMNSMVHRHHDDPG